MFRSEDNYNCYQTIDTGNSSLFKLAKPNLLQHFWCKLPRSGPCSGMLYCSYSNNKLQADTAASAGFCIVIIIYIWWKDQSLSRATLLVRSNTTCLAHMKCCGSETASVHCGVLHIFMENSQTSTPPEGVLCQNQSHLSQSASTICKNLQYPFIHPTSSEHSCIEANTSSLEPIRVWHGRMGWSREFLG